MALVLMIVYFFFPAVGLSLFVRLAPPIYHLCQRTPSARLWILLVNGLLCFVLTAGAVSGLLALLSSYIGYSETVTLSFETSRFSQVPGVTAENVRQYDGPVFQELEFRQFLVPWDQPGQVCFASDATVCQLADKAMEAPSGFSLLTLVALVPTALNVFLGWYLLRPRA